jgi:hypothetical protein
LRPERVSFSNEITDYIIYRVNPGLKATDFKACLKVGADLVFDEFFGCSYHLS